MADADGNKEITLKELTAQPLLKALRFYFKAADTDGNKTLNIDEFAKLLLKKSYPENKCTILQELDPLYAAKVTECSVDVDCYKTDTDAYDNSVCGDYDSCAYIKTDTM